MLLCSGLYMYIRYGIYTYLVRYGMVLYELRLPIGSNGKAIAAAAITTYKVAQM